MQNPSPFQVTLPQLDISNIPYWPELLTLAATSQQCEAHLLEDVAEPEEPAQNTILQKTLAACNLLILSSLIPDSRIRLGSENFGLFPYQIIEHLRTFMNKTDPDTHEQIELEAKTLIIKRSNNTAFIAKHREVRDKMIMAQYPNITNFKTTVKLLSHVLRRRPDYAPFAMMLLFTNRATWMISPTCCILITSTKRKHITSYLLPASRVSRTAHNNRAGIGAIAATVPVATLGRPITLANGALYKPVMHIMTPNVTVRYAVDRPLGPTKYRMTLLLIVKM